MTSELKYTLNADHLRWYSAYLYRTSPRFRMRRWSMSLASAVCLAAIFTYLCANSVQIPFICIIALVAAIVIYFVITYFLERIYVNRILDSGELRKRGLMPVSYHLAMDKATVVCTSPHDKFEFAHKSIKQIVSLLHRHKSITIVYVADDIRLLIPEAAIEDGDYESFMLLLPIRYRHARPGIDSSKFEQERKSLVELTGLSISVCDNPDRFDEAYKAFWACSSKFENPFFGNIYMECEDAYEHELHKDYYNQMRCYNLLLQHDKEPRLLEEAYQLICNKTEPSEWEKGLSLFFDAQPRREQMGN